MLEHIHNNSMYSTNIQVPIECLENLTEEEDYKEKYEIHV